MRQRLIRRHSLHTQAKGATLSYMHFAQDPKVKTPTMTELVSDLSLRYITLEVEEHEHKEDALASLAELATLASVLFTITGHREWQSKSSNHHNSVRLTKMALAKRRRDETAAHTSATNTAIATLDRASWGTDRPV